MSCPHETSVLAFADGRGDVAERAAIEAHIDGCAACLELIVHAVRLAPTGNGDAADAAIGGPSASVRYELGPEIARGGMGRIFIARDTVLGRDVAIKCVRDDRPSLETRFAREIELTARLQHPAIVPIHDTGRLPDGRRFYAMPRIGGMSLDRRIAEAADLSSRLSLVPHFIALVDAMAYVHRQGVIHRDLKPHNVLIGEFGETVLVDWGLAKKLGEQDVVGYEPADAIEAAIEAATRDGEVVGTRGYMSPEQASGGEVGPAADVYALGATLVHLLTGRAVVSDEPIGTSLHLRSAPLDLVAIAARAMAANPASRYPSASELAQDLHRFQTGRLVEARQYSASQLAWRWIGRHRKILAIVTAAFLAIVTIGCVAIVRVLDASAVAEAERARAERNRDAAQQLVAFVLDKLRDELEQVGRLDALAGTAHEVVDYYDRVQSGSGRPDDRLYRAMAVGLLGDNERDRGNSTAAVGFYRQSVELARSAAEQNPSPRAEEQLVRALHELGAVLHGPEAFAALHESDLRARRGLESDPKSATLRWLVANIAVDLAGAAHNANDDPTAERLLDAAIEDAQRLEAAGDARGTRTLARAAERLAQLRIEQLKWDLASATAELLRAAALRDVARTPESTEARIVLSFAWERTGVVHEGRRHYADAEAAYRECYAIRAALVALDPTNAKWSEALGTAEERLGQLAQNRHDKARAIAHLTASRDISQRLADQDHLDTSLANELGVSELNLGDALGDFDEPSRARSAMRRALAIFQQIERDTPSTTARLAVAVAWLHLGNLEASTHNATAAREAFERGLEIGRAVVAEVDSPFTRQLLAEGLLALADVAPSSYETSIAEAAQLIAPLRHLADTDPGVRDTLAEIDRKQHALRASRRP